MSDVTITLADRPPEEPKSDFAFYIDFKKGEGSPSRVFSATHDFIRACERVDRDLVRAVDSNIEAVLMLEDIEAASLKTWLRNALTAADDQGIKDLDWKPLVGKYLVRAKYAILRWIDDDSTPRNLTELAHEIRQIAADTDVRHMPDYAAPSAQTLITAIKDFQNVKDTLASGDRASYISAEGELELRLNMRWSVDDIEALAVSRTLESPPSPMILAVKKPDYLGASQWDFRLGRRTVQAKIIDTNWVRRFQAREEDVRPGDALECLVVVEQLYGHDNELISERFTITEVRGVLRNQFTQAQLFED